MSDSENNEIDSDEIVISDEDGEDEGNDEKMHALLANRVKTFVQIDDQIKVKKEELKELSDKIKPLEQWLIDYLTKKNLESVDIPNGKLVKNEVESKGPLKTIIIEETIMEKIKQDKVFDTDAKCTKAIEDILKKMETKREITVKTNIKRTTNRGGNKGVKKNIKKGNVKGVKKI